MTRLEEIDIALTQLEAYQEVLRPWWIYFMPTILLELMLAGILIWLIWPWLRKG